MLHVWLTVLVFGIDQTLRSQCLFLGLTTESYSTENVVLILWITSATFRKGCGGTDAVYQDEGQRDL